RARAPGGRIPALPDPARDSARDQVGSPRRRSRHRSAPPRPAGRPALRRRTAPRTLPRTTRFGGSLRASVRQPGRRGAAPRGPRLHPAPVSAERKGRPPVRLPRLFPPGLTAATGGAMFLRRSRGTGIALLAGGLLVGCTDGRGPRGETQVPTRIVVDPADFLGTTPCQPAPGAMRSYQVTLFDVTEDLP